MSDMKCPFCQQELKHEKTTGIYCCPRTFIDCPLGLGTGAFGTKELWQALTDSMKEHDLCHDALVERTKELERTSKALEQSEICCTEWEKQALDYKAENIALSGDLERTRKALDVAVDALKEYADRDNWGMGFAPWLEDGFKDALYTEDGYKTAEKALEQITALEQKDVK